MIDFERTHRLRRDMSEALQKSQRMESQAAKQSAEIAEDCKRRLLVHLSAWLLELDSANTLTVAEREEVQSLTRMSLGEWIQLQAVAVQTESDLKEAQGREQEALAMLRKKAPVGGITKMLAGAEAKTQIASSQNDVASARKHRENLSAKLQQNLEKRLALGEIFLRDCIRQWDKLALTRALGKEAGEILRHMTLETDAIWVGHQQQQTQELDQVGKILDGLRDNYKDSRVSSPHRYKAPSAQEQNETHREQGNWYDFKE